MTSHLAGRYFFGPAGTAVASFFDQQRKLSDACNIGGKDCRQHRCWSICGIAQPYCQNHECKDQDRAEDEGWRKGGCWPVVGTCNTILHFLERKHRQANGRQINRDDKIVLEQSGKLPNYRAADSSYQRCGKKCPGESTQDGAAKIVGISRTSIFGNKPDNAGLETKAGNAAEYHRGHPYGYENTVVKRTHHPHKDNLADIGNGSAQYPDSKSKHGNAARYGTITLAADHGVKPVQQRQGLCSQT